MAESIVSKSVKDGKKKVSRGLTAVCENVCTKCGST